MCIMKGVHCEWSCLKDVCSVVCGLCLSEVRALWSVWGELRVRCVHCEVCLSSVYCGMCVKCVMQGVFLVWSAQWSVWCVSNVCALNCVWFVGEGCASERCVFWSMCELSLVHGFCVVFTEECVCAVSGVCLCEVIAL